MRELTLNDVAVVSGAGPYGEACLDVGGAGALAGAFFSPAGAAAGGLIGCGAGMLYVYFTL